MLQIDPYALYLPLRLMTWSCQQATQFYQYHIPNPSIPNPVHVGRPKCTSPLLLTPNIRHTLAAHTMVLLPQELFYLNSMLGQVGWSIILEILFRLALLKQGFLK